MKSCAIVFAFMLFVTSAAFAADLPPDPSRALEPRPAAVQIEDAAEEADLLEAGDLRFVSAEPIFCPMFFDDCPDESWLGQRCSDPRSGCTCQLHEGFVTCIKGF